MDILERQIRRAQRRLFAEHLLRALTWSCTLTLATAAIMIGVDRIWPLGIALLPTVGAALASGIALAGGYAWATRLDASRAALEIDRRFGLRERVSSSWLLAAAERESPMGQALLADAARRVERIEVAERFRLAVGPWSLLPLAPAVLAFLLSVLVDPASRQQASARQEINEATRQVQTSTRTLEKKLSERRQRADREGLKDAESLFERLERETQELARLDDVDRKQALVNLNNLAQELEKRKEALGGTQALKEQFNQLKDLQRGPADRFAQAMRKGDFKQAQRELQRLKEELERGDLSQEDREQLAQQMEAMADKLNKMAEAQQRAQEELEKQLEDARRSGDRQRAEEIERQLDELQQKSSHMQQMQQMCDKLGQCSQALAQGEGQAALDALGDLVSQLDDLQRQLDEMEMYDQVMDDIAQAKNEMNCKACQGGGCASCRGDGRGDGDGLGRGRGTGYRPEEENPTNAYDTNVKQKTTRGSADVVDYVDGPNTKGAVQQEINDQFERARAQETDPLTEQRLPRGYREHAKGYFDTLREGR